MGKPGKPQGLHVPPAQSEAADNKQDSTGSGEKDRKSVV